MIATMAIIAVCSFFISVFCVLGVMFTMDSGPDWLSTTYRLGFFFYTGLWICSVLGVLGLAIASLFT